MHKKAPFRGRRMGDVKLKIKKQKINFKKDLDPEIKQLIIRMLQIDPNKRPDAAEILTLPFVQRINQSIDDKFFSKPSSFPSNNLTNRLTRKKNVRYGISKNEMFHSESKKVIIKFIINIFQIKRYDDKKIYNKSLDTNQNFFKKKKSTTQTTIESDFFSDSIPLDSKNKAALIKGKYGYNLAGFENGKTSIARNENIQQVNDYSNKYLFKNFKSSTSLVKSDLHLSSKINKVTNYNQTLNFDNSISFKNNLVESTFQFQEPEPKKYKKKEKNFENDSEDDQMKTKVRKMEASQISKDTNISNYKVNKFKRHLSTQNLHFPITSFTEKNSLLQISNNLKKAGFNKEQKTDKPKPIKRHESSANIVFQNYKPFEQATVNQDSHTNIKSSNRVKSLNKNAIKKFNNDKIMSNQYMIKKKKSKSPEKYRIYTKNYLKNDFPVKKSKNNIYKTHSKSISINENFFSKKKSFTNSNVSIPTSKFSIKSF
jgi:hypothetical protein